MYLELAFGVNLHMMNFVMSIVVLVKSTNLKLPTLFVISRRKLEIIMALYGFRS